MRCWECGQELDTSEIVRNARVMENMRIQQVILSGVRLLREKGDYRAADAMEALADAMAASPIP